MCEGSCDDFSGTKQKYTTFFQCKSQLPPCAILRLPKSFQWTPKIILPRFALSAPIIFFFFSQPSPISYKPSPDLHQAWCQHAPSTFLNLTKWISLNLSKTSSRCTPNLNSIFFEMVPTTQHASNFKNIK